MSQGPGVHVSRVHVCSRVMSMCFDHYSHHSNATHTHSSGKHGWRFPIAYFGYGSHLYFVDAHIELYHLLLYYETLILHIINKYAVVMACV